MTDIQLSNNLTSDKYDKSLHNNIFNIQQIYAAFNKCFQPTLDLLTSHKFTQPYYSTCDRFIQPSIPPLTDLFNLIPPADLSTFNRFILTLMYLIFDRFITLFNFFYRQGINPFLQV